MTINYVIELIQDSQELGLPVNNIYTTF
jgi:hypothetical protein